MSPPQGSSDAQSAVTSGESTNEYEALIARLIERIAEELGEALARTPVSIASWVHVRRAYQTSLSLLRLLSAQGRSYFRVTQATE